MPLAAQRRGNESPSTRFLSLSLLPALAPAPQATSLEPPTPWSSQDRKEQGGNTVPPGKRLAWVRGPPQEHRAAGFPEPCARPVGGNARSLAAVAGRGLGGAGEGGRRREFEESYRQRAWQEPAVSLETADQ